MLVEICVTLNDYSIFSMRLQALVHSIYLVEIIMIYMYSLKELCASRNISLVEILS